CSNRTATATTALYTLSLHDALPIYVRRSDRPTAANARLGRRWTKGVERSSDVLHAAEQLERVRRGRAAAQLRGGGARAGHLQLGDRKSTRLNSSHVKISYAVFCLKK